MRQLGIAIVGMGMGAAHLQHANAHEQAKVVAICDIDEQYVLRLQRENEVPFATTRFEDILERDDVQIVSIATPDWLHCEMTLAALRAGKHVLVEKPLDVTVEGCDAMIAAADAAGRILQVDFHKRYDPYHRHMAAQIAAGRLGQVLYGYAWMEDRLEVPRDWFPRWAPSSSPFWFLGVHMVDLIRFCIRARGVRVFATAAKRKLASLGVDTFDCVNAKIAFENGAAFAVDASWALPDRFEAVVNQGIRIVGTEGIMEVDSQNRGAEACLAGTGQETWNLGFYLEQKDADGQTRWSGYGIDSIADFAHNVNALLRGASLEQLHGRYADGRDARETTRIAVAAHESVRTGKAVDIG